MIEKVANLTIKNAGNDSNGENARDLQVQFAGNPAENFHKNLLSGWEIGITHEEVPVLVTLIQPGIIANNQPTMTFITGVI